MYISIVDAKEGNRMSGNELVEILTKAGFKLIRTGKSSLRVYSNGKVEVNVHYHGQQELGKGIANKYLRQAGLK